MDKWVGRVALVTGASAGIGAAVCKRLAEHGMKVVGCARNMDKIQVNVIGLMICSREAIKSMEEREVDDGQIVLLSSIANHHVLNQPDIHVYASTKFAIRAITEGLRNELYAKRSHIRVTSISPGMVETEFASRMYPNIPTINEIAFGAFKALQPEDIAETIIYSLSAPVHVQVHDVIIRPTEGPN